METVFCCLAFLVAYISTMLESAMYADSIRENIDKSEMLARPH